MGFFPSLASVIAAIFGLSIGAAAASADAIPGPPLAVSASDPVGAYCPLPASAEGSAVAFAAGVLITAIAARRRDPGA
jgi:hypothetical protein